ncbi:hypothetical protein BKA66DRAFT_458241 [Pyrenochaeta sp. MPI-SDFR-AT-0127]|nr:hypothetical protein BKA66DRAFT_458241 [Pyrenochaeta sp. MPI-SDFR-AT-0127]
MSPPTNDEGIVTAQQTPITPVHVQDVPSKVETANVNMPQGEVSKKKKKKPKKKSKKLAKAVVKASEPTESKEPDSADIDGSALSECGSGIGEDYDLYDPFNSQLSHIDAIRRSLKNEDSYFAQANARMKADNDMKTDHAEKMKTLSEPDLMRQIEGYIMENGSRFLSGAKKLSKNDVK